MSIIGDNGIVYNAKTFGTTGQVYQVDRINHERPQLIPAAGHLSNDQSQLHFGTPMMPGRNEATVRVTVDYANYCPRTVFAMGVNNAPFAIAPVNNIVNPYEHRNHVEVRIELKLISNDAIWETYEMFRAFILNNVPLDLDAMGLWESLNSFYQNDARTTHRRNFTFCFVYRVLEDELANTELHTFKPTSMLMSFNREALAKPHPYSDLGFKHQEHQVPKSQEHTGMLISVVDNLRLSPIRYYYAGRRTIGVPSQYDRNSKDGVYVTIMNGCAYGAVEKQVFHYTFEEAKEKLGLYLTKQEAETHGNPELLLKAKAVEETRKLEEKKHHHEIKVLDQKTTQVDMTAALEAIKLDNARLKERIEADRVERDNEAAILKSSIEHERIIRDETLNRERAYREEIINRERTLRNDHYDHRETIRKDKADKKATKRKGWLDSLKITQLIAGAVLGLGGLLLGKKLTTA